MLVIATDPYKYHVALSDIAGWDIRPHAANYEQAIAEVRRWLVSNRVADKPTSQILGDYLAYQEWDYERLLVDGWQEPDVQDRQTAEILAAMHAWVEAGRPPGLD